MRFLVGGGNMNRKIKRFFSDTSTIFLIISFIITILSFIIAINNVRETFLYNYQKDKFDRSFYKITSNGSEEQNFSDFENVIENSKINGIYTLPINTPISNSENSNLKMANLVGVNDNSPNIFDKNKLYGRYFNEGDGKYGKKVAIIGELLSEQTYERDNKRFIKLSNFDAEYEVIGVIKGNTYLDSFFFVPIRSLPAQLVNYSDVSLSLLVQSSNEISNVYELKNNLHNINMGLYTPKTLLSILIESINYEKEMLQSTIIMVILGIISILIFSVFWVESLKRKFAIFRVVGANNLYIVIYILSRLLVISVIAVVIAFCFSILISKILVGEKIIIDTSVILLSFTLSCIISIIATVSSFIEILRFKLTYIIK